jgi:ribosomal 50S subunit-recycling heat shock protein
MRLDKYLKVSRIIKRRTVAKEACDKGIVTINGKLAKSSSVVNLGDVLEISFGTKIVKYEVTEIKEHVLKNDAKEMYKLLEEKRIEEDWK